MKRTEMIRAVCLGSVGQMLMYGEDTANGCDIPGQWFNSLRKDTVLEDDKVHAPVGAEYIKRNPDEAYCR